MNDQPDDLRLENELLALRPAAISARFESRVFGLLADPGLPRPRPAWWQRLGFSRPAAVLGWGLASPIAAAVVTLLVVRTNAAPSLPSPPPRHASLADEPARRADRGVPSKQMPDTLAANVLHETSDEGVVPDGGRGMVRRVRYRSTDHVQWRNPRTGAEWEVSYPREDVLLVPINAE